MHPFRLKTFFIFWALLVCLAPFSANSSAAEVDENALWSMEFNGVTISDALKQITQTTGIKIITPKGLGNQVITKSYKDRTIEYILKDMFRDTNYALVWSYGEKGVEAVKIMTLDKGSGAGAGYSTDGGRSTIRDHPGASYPSQRQVSPRRVPSAPRRSVMDRDSEEAEPDASPEEVEKEEAQEEEESKEEEKEPQGADEESDEEAPKPSTKSGAPTVEDTERGEDLQEKSNNEQ